MSSNICWRRFSGLIVAGVWLCLGIPESADAAPRQTLSPHHVPAVTSRLKATGRVPATKELELEIGLPPRNQDQLNTLLQELYDPASTNFHQFLKQQEYIQGFGPIPSDYQALTNFVLAHGLKVTRTFPDCPLLAVSGTATNIENTFHLHLLVYPHPTEARNFFAPDTEPTLDLDVPVLDISGLDDFVTPKPMGLHIASHKSAPQPLALTGSGPYGTFVGNDFRAAYAPGVSLTGAGQSVGLMEFDGFYASDITSYEQLAGLPNVPVV